jgi:hypothetical protein
LSEKASTSSLKKFDISDLSTTILKHQAIGDFIFTDDFEIVIHQMADRSLYFIAGQMIYILLYFGQV